MEKDPVTSDGRNGSRGGIQCLTPQGRFREHCARLAPWLRVSLGLLFIYSGATKAWDPAAFAADIANYRLTPWALTAAAALYLPWLEIAAGLGMFFRRARGGGLLIISSLLSVFCMALGSAWLSNLNIHCGCFGGGGTGIHLALARNVVLLAACAIVAVAGRRDGR